MSSVITQTGATETVVAGPIVDSNGNPLTGLTSIKVAVFRASDLTFLDWSTMGFTATPVTLYQALTELDSVRVPGVYYLKINTSSFTGTSTNDRYFASVSQQGASTAVNALQMGEFRIGTIVDKVETNLDTNVGSRAAPGAAMALTSGERTTTAGVVLDAALAGHTTAGSVGVALANLDAAVSSRLATSGYTAPLSAATTAAAVWNALSASYAGTGSFGAILGAPLTLASNAITSAVLAASAVTAIQSGMATAAGLTSLQSHGDSTWATVTGFATSSALATAQAAITAIQGTGFVGGVDDLHSAHALLSGASTGTSLSAAVTTINSHTDSATNPLATASALTSVGNAVANTPSLVWEELLSRHTTTGTYGLLAATALPLVDVTVSSRAVPGSAMALVGGAITALQAAILSDATPFAGAAIAALPGAILDTALAGHTTAGTVGAALGAASPAGLAAAVWATSEAGAPGTFGYGLWALRVGMTNKMGVTAPGTMIVYADDSATPFLTWTGVRDGTGQPITLPPGEPSQRLKAG